MKRYYNETNNKWYREGQSLTIVHEGVLHSGIPTEEQLKEWGYKLVKEPTPVTISEEEQAYNDRQARMNFLQSELNRTDYIAIKASEGCDVSEYGDWKAMRNAWREEYNELEMKQEEYLKSLQVEEEDNKE